METITKNLTVKTRSLFKYEKNSGAIGRDTTTNDPTTTLITKTSSLCATGII